MAISCLEGDAGQQRSGGGCRDWVPRGFVVCAAELRFSPLSWGAIVEFRQGNSWPRFYLVGEIGSYIGTNISFVGGPETTVEDQLGGFLSSPGEK